ncbi:hypothetical protein D2A34_19180 [Clostridium chromiireducens]|uniref:Uncharacterized protein n=1 Tax=Clostridium chromiireducens TaxID=225345 RepID=A0A399IJ79_9CLOT|nr:hypothetical protein [Clostridium chromiireducens]RII32961.1 hypothetical protein D2A34_19180 [Clostridium chromiireducens]
MIKEYSLESLLAGSITLSKKYMKVSDLSREFFKKSVDFAIENNIAVNNPEMEEYRYVAMGSNYRGERVERNFVLVRPLKNELSFHIWRNEYKLDLKDLSYKTTKHNGPDWIVLNADTNEKLNKIFAIILELYGNA